MATAVRRIPAEPEAIPNQYIVVFKKGVESAARRQHRAWAAERNFSALSTHGHGHGNHGLISKFNLCEGELCGYSARITEGLAQEINDTQEVRYLWHTQLL